MWRWGPQEQQRFDELKDKVANTKCLGVPKAQGEITMVTDACNVGGGGTLFQWQALQGDRETQGEVTGQGRPPSPKLVQSAEGGKGKERTKGRESLWLLEAPVRKIVVQMDTPARTSQSPV